MGYKDNWNKKKYDSVNIRFPSGTKARFIELFGSDVSFNGWVVGLVTSRLLLKEYFFADKRLPPGDDPLDYQEAILDNNK